MLSKSMLELPPARLLRAQPASSGPSHRSSSQPVACAFAGDDVIAQAAEDVDLGVGAFLDPRHGEELAALGSDVLATANSLGRWSQPQRHSGEALVPFIGG